MTGAQKKTAGLAIASLVLGIAGMLMIGPLGAIPAVICGHMALSRIKSSEGELEGHGLAVAGLVMGYVSIGLMVIMIPMCAAIAIPSFVKARDVSQLNACINNMRMIDSGKEQAAMAHRYSDGQSIPEQEVSKYIKGGLESLYCPAGGVYTANPVGEDPECSTHGALSTAHQNR